MVLCHQLQMNPTGSHWAVTKTFPPQHCLSAHTVQATQETSGLPDLQQQLHLGCLVVLDKSCHQ